MASRDPKHLHPNLRALFQQFDAEMRRQKIDYALICTYRSGEEQNALYAQGRTTPGKIVTRARAGQSAHNYTLAGKPAAKAFDIVILKCGKADWSEKNPDWQRAGEIGMALGLKWYGKPGSPFREYPHFQLVER